MVVSYRRQRELTSHRSINRLYIRWGSCSLLGGVGGALPTINANGADALAIMPMINICIVKGLVSTR